jgi:hypothetical protein
MCCDVLRPAAASLLSYPQPWRPSLQQLFEDYWALMPEYQGLEGGLGQLEFLRLLFGVFPTFRESPLQPGFDRWGQLRDVHVVCVCVCRKACRKALVLWFV